jgi:hypothetical protein
MRHQIIILIVCVLSACNNWTELEYYKTGEVKLKTISYPNTKKIRTRITYNIKGLVVDSANYSKNQKLEGLQYVYDTVNHIKKYYEYLNGDRHGYVKLIYNNGRRITQMYFNDTIHGIEKRYENNILKSEILWLRGNVLAYRCRNDVKLGDTLMNMQKTYKGIRKIIKIAEVPYYFISNSIVLNKENLLIGTLSYNLDNSIINTVNNSFVHLSIKDSITNSQKPRLNLEGHFGNFKKDVHLELKLGELTNNFELKDIYLEKRTSVGELSLSVELDKFKKGYNLVLGILELKRNQDIIIRCVIYKDFFVKDS